MRNALRVAGGIFLSRIFGFLRDAATAFFFGAGPHADVFRTVLRLPNLLQNLLGEQTLSAAFIPGLSRMVEEGRREDARRFAGAVLGLLVAVAAGLALLGVLAARPLVILFSAGYLKDAAGVAAGVATVDRLELAVAAVRWTFPMAGFLVLAAWALTVLNSHRRFFLPYVAPVIWNAAILTALFWGALRLGWAGFGAAPPQGSGPLGGLVLAACLGGLTGGALQFAVQLPAALRLLGGLRPSWSLRAPGVRAALKAFWPMLLGRGAVQLSAFLDIFLASLLVTGAQSALGWAQTLYVLPVSLFAMSVAAAELPELARQAGRAQEVAARAGGSLRQIAYLVVPTAVGFLAFGLPLVSAVYRRGNFGAADAWLVYLVLTGYTLGLPAVTWSRLLQNVYFALDDTRRPARWAVLRVVFATLLGLPLMFWLDRHAVGELAGLPAGARPLFLGALGLALASGVTSWLELALLRRGLEERVPGLRLPLRRALVFALWTVPAAAAAGGVWWWLREAPRLPLGAAAVAAFAAVYLLATRLAGLPEARAWYSALGRRASR
ncbi:MAG: murein biosynthesis integral membrane protein MurJ [Thermoanaerobaculia bacterium]